MENNVTFEIQQPEFRSSIDSTDSESFDTECDQSIFGNIRDASSLLEDSDDDEDEEDEKEEDKDVNNNHPVSCFYKILESGAWKVMENYILHQVVRDSWGISGNFFFITWSGN